MENTCVRYLIAFLILLGLGIAVSPAAIYDGGFTSIDAPLSLRVATGGAGQSGLLKVLADAFIKQTVRNGSAPLKIAWVLSDTTNTISNLRSGDADVGITYTPAAEQLAIQQGVADPKYYYYLFRDHFLITGPPENPANIKESDSVNKIFSDLFAAAQSPNSTIETRFLSRYDKSATNIKESLLWLGIGQAPWATPYSTWYHQYIAFPIQALTTSINLKEYTLTDKSTYLSIPKSLREKTVVYKTSSDNESDPLLNPGHLLVGTKAQNVDIAHRFANWAISAKGQKVITKFKKSGVKLYSGAP